MDQQEADNQLRYVRALVAEMRAEARLMIAKGNRVMHECPALPPLDPSALYAAINLCNKVDAALAEMNIGKAMGLFAELTQLPEAQETETDVD